MSLYYYIPTLLYYTPSAVWQYVIMPLGKGVVSKVYQKVNKYMYPAETRDGALEEEFIQHLRSQNVRVYEVLGDTVDQNGIRTRFLILENSGRTRTSFTDHEDVVAGKKDFTLTNEPVHL